MYVSVVGWTHPKWQATRLGIVDYLYFVVIFLSINYSKGNLLLDPVAEYSEQTVIQSNQTEAQLVVKEVVPSCHVNVQEVNIGRHIFYGCAEATYCDY